MTIIEIKVKITTDVTTDVKHRKQDGTFLHYDYRVTKFNAKDDVEITVTSCDYGCNCNCNSQSTDDEEEEIINKIKVILDNDDYSDTSKLVKITKIVYENNKSHDGSNNGSEDESNNGSINNITLSNYPYVKKFIKMDDNTYTALMHIKNDVIMENIYVSQKTDSDDYWTFSPTTYRETIPKDLSLTCPNNISDFFESYDTYNIYKKKRAGVGYGAESTFIYDTYVCS